ncbi:Speckle-type POZ protein B [Halotydeus destructor]|nr:Speckle-type POZ protein B [Halotydeus destructor]
MTNLTAGAVGKFSITVHYAKMVAENHCRTGKISEDVYRFMMADKWLPDIEVICKDDCYIPANKLILMARSEVFSAMFTNFNEQKTNAVDMSEYDRTTVEKFLEFLNTDQLLEIDEDAQSLYVMADKYQVPLLKSECENHIAKNINLANVAGLLATVQAIPSIILLSRAIKVKSEMSPIPIAKKADISQQFTFDWTLPADWTRGHKLASPAFITPWIKDMWQALLERDTSPRYGCNTDELKLYLRRKPISGFEDEPFSVRVDVRYQQPEAKYAVGRPVRHFFGSRGVWFQKGQFYEISGREFDKRERVMPIKAGGKLSITVHYPRDTPTSLSSGNGTLAEDLKKYVRSSKLIADLRIIQLAVKDESTMSTILIANKADISQQFTFQWTLPSDWTRGHKLASPTFFTPWLNDMWQLHLDRDTSTRYGSVTDEIRLFMKLKPSGGQENRSFSVRVDVKYQQPEAVYSGSHPVRHFFGSRSIWFRDGRSCEISGRHFDKRDRVMPIKAGGKLFVTVHYPPETPTTLPSGDGTLAEDLKNYLRSGNVSSELQIVCKNQKVVRANRLVLMTRSEVFNSMFMMDSEEAKSNQIVLKDYEAEVVESFYDFLRYDRVSCIDDHAQDLYVLADKYQVPLLKSTCEEYISKNITMENSARVLAMVQSIPSILITRALFDYLNPME